MEELLKEILNELKLFRFELSNKSRLTDSSIDYSDIPMILAPKDVANFLRWRKDVVYRLFNSKNFPSQKINGKHFITKEKFLRWFGKSEL